MMRVENKFQIFALLQKRKAELRQLGVRRLGVFGSFARGEQRVSSDVDILVEFEQRKKTFDRFLQLCDLLEITLGRPVEVLTVESLSPYLKPHILREVQYVPFPD